MSAVVLFGRNEQYLFSFVRMGSLCLLTSPAYKFFGVIHRDYKQFLEEKVQLTAQSAHNALMIIE
jgi:hypothetical protein